MPKSLLVAALIAELGCWTTPPPELPKAASAPPPQGAAKPCREAGDRLLLVVCRRDDDLAWTVTNKSTATLWVFVAPPSMTAAPARANAFVDARDGNVMLQKVQLPGPMDEPVMSGAIALAPGASDSGVVPLGIELVADAGNFWPRSPHRQWPRRQRIRTVSLEVGFTPRRATDRPIAPDASHEFYFFMALDSGRQELVRSPGLSWQ